MRKNIIGVMAIAMLLVLGLVAPGLADNHGGEQGPPTGSDDPVAWDGTRGLDSEKCELAEEDGPRNAEAGWLHWVLTPGGPTEVTEAELSVNGVVVGTMSPQGQAGALQFFMPFEVPESAVAVPDGNLGNNALLTISDWCEGEEPDNGNGNGEEPNGEEPNGDNPNGEEPTNGDNPNDDDDDDDEDEDDEEEDDLEEVRPAEAVTAEPAFTG